MSCGDSSGGGGEFAAGLLLGGAVFGTLAYVFAPQVLICHFCTLVFSFEIFSIFRNVIFQHFFS